MSSTPAAAKERGKDYYYAVLGVPHYASAEEIRERYRALSLIFHPDKQHHGMSEEARQTAQKRHLEVQKAYEVLSDPFLRTVYDTLGESATSLKWADHFRDMPAEKLQRALLDIDREITHVRFENRVRPKGEVVIGYNATPIFDGLSNEEGNPVSLPLRERASYVHQTQFNVMHSVKRDVGSRTQLSLAANVNRVSLAPQSIGVHATVLGTVRHQFSPKLAVQAAMPLLVDPRKAIGTTKVTYHSASSFTFLETFFSPRFVTAGIVPPTNIQHTRLLFPKSGVQGTILGNFGQGGPSLTAQITQPRPFDLLPSSPWLSSQTEGEEDEPVQYLPRPGLAAFTRGSVFSQYGITYAGADSRISAEWGVSFDELSIELRSGAHLRPSGYLEWNVTGIWKWMPQDNPRMHGMLISGQHETNISAQVALTVGGVHLNFEFNYLGQCWKLPILLSGQSDDLLALYFALIPATATAVYYSFVARPRQRAKRARILREARARVKDPSSYDPAREAANTVALLADTAARHMRTEAAREGLVIQRASYAPRENGKEIEGLALDVTIPLQALVHRSQLHIPAARSKSHIPGFFDPLPHVEKTLTIQYTFGGREHFAELSDGVPVVLPLADHLKV